VDAGHIEHATFRLNFLTRIPVEKLNILIKQPSDSEFKKVEQVPIKSWFGMSTLSKIPSFTFEWEKPQNGQWALRIESETEPEKIPRVDIEGAHHPDIVLLLENDSPFKVMSHVQSYTFKQGQPVGLVARLYDERKYIQTLRTLKGLNDEASYDEVFAVTEAGESLPLPEAMIPSDGANGFDFEMDIVFPDGQEKKVKMVDEALARGENSPSGVYTATVKADQPGKYFAEVQLAATGPSREQLTRTTQHMFTVVSEEEDLSVVDGAFGEFDPEDKMVTIHIPLEAKVVTNIVGERLKAYAEVWGGNTPVAFASGMTVVSQQSDKFPGQDSVVLVSLKVHANWITRANIDSQNAEFTLRNVYVQDLSTSVPLASADKIRLNIHKNQRALLQIHSASNAFNGEITEEMKKGPRPVRYSKSQRQLFAGSNNGHKIVLSHGYCAAGIPFSTAKFENFAEFDDPNQNRNNDEFAQLLGAFGEQYDSFSLVAHSQGGIASLHLLAFYWSALDLNEEHGDNHRWIQAMGTPFQGTTLAGWGDTGKIIGVGCGSNDNLTPEGAKLWLTGIPMEARQHVYYYYTEYKPWSWCSLPANAVLSWPNDGTSESKRVPLAGGNKVLMKKGFCHTTDMKYPPQCKDEVNNEFMNKKAARK